MATSTAKRRKTASRQAAQTPKGGSAQAMAELHRLFAKPEKLELRWWFNVGQQALLLHPEARLSDSEREALAHGLDATFPPDAPKP